jgi:hypothetical protein
MWNWLQLALRDYNNAFFLHLDFLQAREYSCTWEKNTHTILVENSDGKEAFARPKAKWQDNINLEPREIK